MSKATTIKEALKRWEEKHPGESAQAATVIELQFQWPPIEKMDNTLSTLVNCESVFIQFAFAAPSIMFHLFHSFHSIENSVYQRI